MPPKLRYPSKAHQEYKASYHSAYPTVQHVSSNMQSSPHDNSRNYPYQRHHQNSLSSTHSPNYLDHSGQPMGYHPGMQTPQVQRSTYGHHPQDHQGMLPLLSELISTNVSVNSNARRPPGHLAKPPYHPAIGVIYEPPIFPSALCFRCESRGRVIEPRRSSPLPVLPTDRTWTAYCPITTSYTFYVLAETLSKHSESGPR